MSIQDTLNERQHTHGSFAANAHCAQTLIETMRQQQSWAGMPAVHREALEAIQRKIARLLCGNSFTVDSVRDIIGYAQLYMNDLLISEGAVDVETTTTIRLDGKWIPQTKASI